MKKSFIVSGLASLFLSMSNLVDESIFFQRTVDDRYSKLRINKSGVAKAKRAARKRKNKR